MATSHQSAAGRRLKGKPKTVTIGGKGGQKPITFQKGGLHRSLGVPQGQKIPASKMSAAASGSYGPKAQKQANFAQGLLAKGRRTARNK